MNSLPEMVRVDKLCVGDVYKTSNRGPYMVVGKCVRDDGSAFLSEVMILPEGKYSVSFTGYDPAYPQSLIMVEYLGRGSFDVKLPGK